MKKSKKRIIILLLLIALLIVISLTSGDSYSKYITKVEGKGVIEVAKWAFLVNGQTASITKLNLANTYNPETLTQNRIAPGTRGSFDIVIDATGSNVGIDYNVSFTNEINKPQNLQFIYENNVVSSVKELEQYLTGTINANSSEKIKKMTIEWLWPYQSGNTEEEKVLEDKEDTQNGQTLGSYKFDIVITGTQIEPTI